nr:hypothetical protein DGKKSRWO_DGKKSRWO_CDS_0097 [uncultured phage]CAI9752274.1 hypothetical protein CVNMHQAP_CVNMHQAP_CDS_0097 [uncultured phage]
MKKKDFAEFFNNDIETVYNVDRIIYDLIINKDYTQRETASFIGVPLTALYRHIHNDMSKSYPEVYIEILRTFSRHTHFRYHSELLGE